MKWIFDLFAAGSAVLIFAYIIVWDIARIVYFIKCAGVKKMFRQKVLCKRYLPKICACVDKRRYRGIV